MEKKLGQRFLLYFVAIIIVLAFLVPKLYKIYINQKYIKFEMEKLMIDDETIQKNKAEGEDIINFLRTDEYNIYKKQIEDVITPKLVEKYYWAGGTIENEWNYKDREYILIQFVDMDDDGTKEMIVESPDRFVYGDYIYTLYDGKVKKIEIGEDEPSVGNGTDIYYNSDYTVTLHHYETHYNINKNYRLRDGDMYLTDEYEAYTEYYAGYDSPYVDLEVHTIYDVDKNNLDEVDLEYYSTYGYIIRTHKNNEPEEIVEKIASKSVEKTPKKIYLKALPNNENNINEKVIESDSKIEIFDFNDKSNENNKENADTEFFWYYDENDPSVVHYTMDKNKGVSILDEKILSFTNQNLIKKVIIDDKITPSSANHLFWEESNYYSLYYSYIALEEIENFENIDISNIADISSMFYGCKKLKSLDLRNWDVSNVTKMDGLFSGCSSLKNLYIDNWDTSNVTSMSHMFSGCTSLESIDISNFDTSNVKSMSGMFADCTSLVNLDTINNWEVDGLKNIDGMFDSCKKLTKLDLSKWDIKCLVSMSDLFNECSSLKELSIGKWCTRYVRSMENAFNNCSSLKELNISNWDTRNLININRTFCGCASLKQLDLNKWNKKYICESIEAFNDCKSYLSSLKDIAKQRLKNVEKDHIKTYDTADGEYNIVNNEENNMKMLIAPDGEVIHVSDAGGMNVIIDKKTNEARFYTDSSVDGEYNVVYEMNGTKTTLDVMESMWVAGDYLICDGVKSLKKIYNIKDINNIKSVDLCPNEIEYDNNIFIASYTEKNNLKTEIYNENFELLKTINPYIYDGVVEIAGKKYYRVRWEASNGGNAKFWFQNILDKNYNLIFEYPVNDIVDEDTIMASYKTNYGRVRYDFEQDKIVDEEIYDGYDKNDFLKYNMDKVYEMYIYDDGIVSIARDEEGYVLLDEKNKPITSHYPSVIYMKNRLGRVKDIIYMIDCSVEKNKSYKYYSLKKELCDLSNEYRFKSYEYGYFGVNDNDKIYIQNVNDDDINFELDGEFNDYSLYVNVLPHKEYIIVREKNDKKYTLYDEKFNKMNIDIDSFDVGTVGEVFVTYRKNITFIYDENLNLIKDINKHYSSILDVAYKKDKVYMCTCDDTINPPFIDIYDENWNIIYEKKMLSEVTYDKQAKVILDIKDK